jgi:hypothetical protein
MANAMVLYCAVHQPLPLRLPALPAPPGVTAADLERCLFDTATAEQTFSDFIVPAYAAALPALASLAERRIPLSLAIPDGFIELVRRWGPGLLKPIRRALRAPLIDAVCAEPVDGLLFAFDIQEFAERMAEARARLAEWTGKPVVTAEVSGFCLNHELYWALGQAGFGTVLAASERYVGTGHHPCHPSAWGDGPVLLHRLTWLSDELANRLRTGPGEPERMADTVAGLPGESALVTFRFDDIAFSSAGWAGALDQLAAFAAACERRGVDLLTASEAGARVAAEAVQSAPPTLTDDVDIGIEGLWRDGWWERLIFGRMQQAAQMTSLIPDHAMRSLGRWLLQRANLLAPRWAVHHAERPATYWRGLWWEQPHSYDETASQVVGAFDTFIRAAAHHVA